MGNYISRKLANPVHRNSKKSIKVILPMGEIRHIIPPPATVSMKAAELMIEVPNFFIVNAKSLKIGRRFHPLNADDDLEKGNVYAMFPMRRKNSVVTAGDMAVLFINTKRASAGNNHNTKVLPESDESPASSAREGSEDDALPRLSLEGIEEASMTQFGRRMSMSRSKKPLMETIEEETVVRGR